MVFPCDHIIKKKIQRVKTNFLGLFFPHSFLCGLWILSKYILYILIDLYLERLYGTYDNLGDRDMVDRDRDSDSLDPRQRGVYKERQGQLDKRYER